MTGPDKIGQKYMVRHSHDDSVIVASMLGGTTADQSGDGKSQGAFLLKPASCLSANGAMSLKMKLRELITRLVRPNLRDA